MQTVDLSKMTLRELNHALHHIKDGSNETAWEVLNPKGSHAVVAESMGCARPSCRSRSKA
ncbi:MAG: hypothetical protein H0T56_10320 [Pseudaminobacter sp.]|nr:hypothetical protein [Pseudaminobacter sp.]